MTMVSGGAPTPVERFRHPNPADRDSDEIDLVAYVRMLWSYRLVIVATAMVFGAIPMLSLLNPSRTYEAEVSIIISQSKVGDRPDGSTPFAMFRPLLESRNVAASVIQELKLNEGSRNVSATTFFDNLVTITEVRGSPVVTLKVALDDPALAARAANLVAERAVELSRGVSQREALRSRDDLQQQRDEARARMEQATENLRKFQEASQAELVRKDVDSMLNQRGELLGLLIKIESEKAKLARAEEDLSGRERIGTIKRTIDSDPAMLETARRAASPSTNLLTLESRNEFISPVYEQLDAQIATSRATLAALERQKTQMVDVRKLDAPQVAQLTNLYRVEGELSHLTVERDLATTVYRQVATAYETARVQVASRSAQLEVLDPAVAPDRPVSRHISRAVMLWFLAGLVLASIGALIYGTFLTDGPTTPVTRGA